MNCEFGIGAASRLTCRCVIWIVDIAKIMFNKGFAFTAKVSYQFGSAHVLHALHLARALCTPKTQVMHHRMALVELYQCTKFHVAGSKVPESEGAYACAMFTCIARALCTPSRNDRYHRITLIQLQQCSKFGVDSSKFTKTGGPLSNKLVRSWRAQPASYKNGNHKNK